MSARCGPTSSSRSSDTFSVVAALAGGEHDCGGGDVAEVFGADANAAQDAPFGSSLARSPRARMAMCKVL